MLWIPACAGMTEPYLGLDKSDPYIYIDRRDACPTLDVEIASSLHSSQ